MKEHIEAIHETARTLYQITDGKDTVSRQEQKLLQSIIDDLQEHCDEIANARLPWED